MPTILDSFSSIPQVLRYGWFVEVVGRHNSGRERICEKFRLSNELK